MAAVGFGIPIPLFWVFFHMAALDFVCNCAGIDAPDWAPESRIFGAVIIGVPLLVTDWFVLWKWRDHRRKEKWGKKYTAEHLPWYAKTGKDRPTKPIKNKYYEP